MDIMELVKLPFVQYALIAGLCIAVSSPLLGITVVTRKMSILGDSLAHLSFAAAIVAIIFNIPLLYLTVPAVIAGSFVVSRISKARRHSSEALIAALSSTSIALGVFAASISKNIQVDVAGILFGSLLALTPMNIGILIALTVGIVILGIWHYRSIVLFLLDEDEAQITGVPVEPLRTALSLIIGLYIAITIQMVGALMVSALLILPAYAALKVTHGIHHAVRVSLLFAHISVLAGLTAGLFFDTPLGPSIVLVAAIVFGLSLFKSQQTQR